jgi:hypothetical protein
MRTFPLRVLKSTWGIAIDLTAEVSEFPPAAVATFVTPRVSLSLGSVRRALSAREAGFLVSGLRRVAADIESAVPDSEPIIINVLDVGFVETDYQPEGLEAAMIGWSAEQFGFEPPEITVEFDNDVNRYVFSFAQQ